MHTSNANTTLKAQKGEVILVKEKLQEIIDFFELEEGYDKQEVIADILDEIKGLKGYSSDEIVLSWGMEELMVFDDFTNEFYEKIIEKVCNVIKSFNAT